MSFKRINNNHFEHNWALRVGPARPCMIPSCTSRTLPYGRTCMVPIWEICADRAKSTLLRDTGERLPPCYSTTNEPTSVRRWSNVKPTNRRQCNDDPMFCTCRAPTSKSNFSIYYSSSSFYVHAGLCETKATWLFALYIPLNENCWAFLRSCIEFVKWSVSVFAGATTISSSWILKASKTKRITLEISNI